MKRNFHTHTTFCDGKNTPEEMAAAAFEKGFEVLGFSGHSYTFFDDTWCMSRKGTQEYQSRVLELKDKYADKMKIHLGVEQDLYSAEGTYGYDFVIGSVHYVLKDGKYWPVDESAEQLRHAIDTGWEGDGLGDSEGEGLGDSEGEGLGDSSRSPKIPVGLP